MATERLRQRLAEGGLPEGHLAPVAAGGHVNDDLEQPADVCHGTNLRFGPVLALDGVDLELPTGGVLGLLGPNGAGKTNPGLWHFL